MAALLPKVAVRAGDWAWSSFALRKVAKPLPGELTLRKWPIERPAYWGRLIEARWKPEHLKSLRECGKRGRPFGDDLWVRRKARSLDLETTLRPRERPTGKKGVKGD